MPPVRPYPGGASARAPRAGSGLRPPVPALWLAPLCGRGSAVTTEPCEVGGSLSLPQTGRGGVPASGTGRLSIEPVLAFPRSCLLFSLPATHSAHSGEARGSWLLIPIHYLQYLQNQIP